MALRTADKLLKELTPMDGMQQMSFQLLHGMLQLSTKKKVNNIIIVMTIFNCLKLKWYKGLCT